MHIGDHKQNGVKGVAAMRRNPREMWGVPNPLSISNTFHLIRITSDKKLIRFTTRPPINKLTLIWRIFYNIHYSLKLLCKVTPDYLQVWDIVRVIINFSQLFTWNICFSFQNVWLNFARNRRIYSTASRFRKSKKNNLLSFIKHTF